MNELNIKTENYIVIFNLKYTTSYLFIKQLRIIES